MNCSEALAIHGDIAGTGVRVSFYIQNILLVLLMKRSPGDTENALWTFVATSFGLTVAALAQLRTDSLTFLDGILVSQLVWFANLGTFLALASYSRSKGKDIVIKLAATLQGYFSMVLTLVMWARSDRLSSSDCSAIKFVFMFAAPLPAIGSGRVTALVFSSLALVVFTGVTGIEVWVWVKRGRLRTGRIPDPEIGRPHEHRGTRHHGRGRYDRFHNRWAHFLANLGSFFFGILLAQILIFAYFVTTTELIISRSHATNPTTWTFGQVLAITVVAPSLIALLRNIKDKWCQCGEEEEEIIRNDLNRSRPSNIGHTSPQPSPSIPLMLYTRDPSRGLSLPHSEEPQPVASS